MNATTKGAISGLLAGGIASANAIVAVLQETPLEAVTGGQWATMGLFGFLAAATGWKSLLADPGK